MGEEEIMSDQCRNCYARGDLEKCKATDDCSIHEAWYTQQLLARIKELEGCLHDLGGAVFRLIDKGYLNTFDEHDEAECDHLSGIAQAAMEHAQKLLFKPKQPEPPADPWLGVWRAKRHTALDNITTKVAFLEPGTIIRVKGVKDGYVHIFFGQEDFEWHTISWLQENFEKVEES